MSQHERVVVGLDIGTTKICAIIARMSNNGKIQVLGLGKAASIGVMRGVVTNIDKTVTAIKEAIEQAETMANHRVTEVYAGIAGQHIKSMQHRGLFRRSNIDDEISRLDVRHLTDDMHKLALPAGDRIIHVLPQEFIVDQEPGIKDPVGMCGTTLEAHFHIITGEIMAARNIQKCIEKSDMRMRDLILEPLASADAVLSEEEKEAGVVLVDIGGGTTDIAIFQDGIIRHTAVIPLGGNIITQDVKEGCMIMQNQAEMLKVKFGSAMPSTVNDLIVTIPGLKGRPPKEISTLNLGRIIRARVEDILDNVYYEIHSSGYEKKLIAGIVLTGGGSNLNHLVQLTELHTGLSARIGLPNEHLLINGKEPVLSEIGHPMYATSIGLVMKGFEHEPASFQSRAEPIAVGEEKDAPKRPGGISLRIRDYWQRSLGWWLEDVDSTQEFSER